MPLILSTSFSWADRAYWRWQLQNWSLPSAISLCTFLSLDILYSSIYYSWFLEPTTTSLQHLMHYDLSYNCIGSSLCHQGVESEEHYVCHCSVFYEIRGRYHCLFIWFFYGRNIIEQITYFVSLRTQLVSLESKTTKEESVHHLMTKLPIFRGILWHYFPSSYYSLFEYHCRDVTS